MGAAGGVLGAAGAVGAAGGVGISSAWTGMALKRSTASKAISVVIFLTVVTIFFIFLLSSCRGLSRSDAHTPYRKDLYRCIILSRSCKLKLKLTSVPPGSCIIPPFPNIFMLVVVVTPVSLMS